MAPAISLRPERAEDAAFLFAVYASTREEELAMTGWDAATRARFLEMQFRAMCQGYRGMFPDAEFAIIHLDGRPAGRAVIDRSGKAIHLVDLALLGPDRNRGVGTRLMRHWLNEAAQANRPLRLSMLKGSPARRLYERLGFTQTGDQGLYEGLEWRPQTSAA
jgi:ribosomal protein S18 acetylase RimI-like enzyme